MPPSGRPVLRSLAQNNSAAAPAASGPYGADSQQPRNKAPYGSEESQAVGDSDIIGNGECVAATTHFAAGLDRQYHSMEGRREGG